MIYTWVLKIKFSAVEINYNHLHRAKKMNSITNLPRQIIFNIVLLVLTCIYAVLTNHKPQRWIPYVY